MGMDRHRAPCKRGKCQDHIRTAGARQHASTAHGWATGRLPISPPKRRPGAATTHQHGRPPTNLGTFWRGPPHKTHRTRCVATSSSLRADSAGVGPGSPIYTASCGTVRPRAQAASKCTAGGRRIKTQRQNPQGGGKRQRRTARPVGPDSGGGRDSPSCRRDGRDGRRVWAGQRQGGETALSIDEQWQPGGAMRWRGGEREAVGGWRAAVVALGRWEARDLTMPSSQHFVRGRSQGGLCGTSNKVSPLPTTGALARWCRAPVGQRTWEIRGTLWLNRHVRGCREAFFFGFWTILREITASANERDSEMTCTNHKTFPTCPIFVESTKNRRCGKNWMHSCPESLPQPICRVEYSDFPLWG